MAERYADRAVRSIFIYSREAHPGENYRHHTSMDDKRHHAKAMQETLGIKRTMLLDDLEGTCHRAYGILPNMTWIMARGGLILYKAAWTNVEDIESALSYSLDKLEKRTEMGFMPFYSERLAWRWRDEDKFRAGLERAGPQAVSDFYNRKKGKVPPGSLDK